MSLITSLIARFMGPTWAHLGPTGPRWAPCWPHDLCYLGCYCQIYLTLKCIYELSVLFYSNDADVKYCSNVYDVSVSFVSLPFFMQYYIDGLGQVCSNAIANAMELLQCYLNHRHIPRNMLGVIFCFVLIRFFIDLTHIVLDYFTDTGTIIRLYDYARASEVTLRNMYHMKPPNKYVITTTPRAQQNPVYNAWDIWCTLCSNKIWELFWWIVDHL